MITIERCCDVSVGHRVYKHEGKCAHLHGHNLRVCFTVAGKMDEVGRVLDFAVVKQKLCGWVDREYDHKFLIFQDDPLAEKLKAIDPEGVVVVPFNPTIENIARHLGETIAPKELEGTECDCVEVRVEETRRNFATWRKTAR
ncbi:MAG: 6-carboxytetrahydropterin synthase [Chloroherpetonaceae bacterium]|nr:6-carboxytetrahydropterin synthase [Chloroherpetonaceae bacterium]